MTSRLRAVARNALRYKSVILLAAILLFLVSCGPNEAERLATIDARIQQAIAAIPTPTPQPTATPYYVQTLATAQANIQQAIASIPTPTPQPTATPYYTQTLATAQANIQQAIASIPTATPQPTATPYYTQALATAQANIQQAIASIPTATPQPTATPMPTATPVKVVDLNDIYIQAEWSVFYVETSRGNGSGWLLEPGFILTAYHVVSNYSSVSIRRPIGQAFSGTVVAFDSRRDIALISFDASSAGLSMWALPLALGDISTADNASPLLALGYGGSGVWADGSVGAPSAHAGILAQIINFTASGFGSNLAMDLSVGSGDSGGPVLDRNGWVVGMTRATDYEQLGTSYAVHVDEIRAALPDLRAGKSR